MPSTPLTIVFVGWQWAVDMLRDPFARLGHKLLRRDPSRMRRSFGDRPSKGPAAPACDVVILAGRDPSEFRFEWEDRPELYQGRLVIDMTCLDDSRGSDWRRESLIEELEARIPTARAVAVGSAQHWGAQLIGGRKDRVYFCGRDEAAKAEADALLRAIGLDTEDLGGPRKARLLQLISGIYRRGELRPLSWKRPFTANEELITTPDELETRARVELHAERITDMTGPSGRREWIRWHIGPYRLDLLGAPDKEGYVLARKLVEWEEALRDETVALFQADVMARVMTEQGMDEQGVATLGHQRTTAPGTLRLLLEARRGIDRFEAIVAQDRLVALLGESRALVAKAVAQVTKGRSLPTTMFAHVTDKRLVVDGETSLPEGATVQLAPVSHIEQEGRFTRIHAPQRFDAEVMHIPTEPELYELEAPSAPEPDVEMTVDYERPADGWAEVTIRIGRHQVTVRASDAVDAPLTYLFRRLVRALANDALPFRDRADEERQNVSIGVRRTTDVDVVLLSVSNLTTASLEALVPRATLLEQANSALRVLETGVWMR